MNRRIQWLRTASLALTLVAATMSLACGGGGGGSAPPPMTGLTATFTPDNSNPPAVSLSMASGGGSGTTFRIDILVKDINDFSGAAFPVRFSTGTASFLSFDAAGSVLEGSGVILDVAAEASQSDPSVILVVVARQGQSVAGVDVVGSQKLITLVFQANSATASNSFQFDVSGGQRVATTCMASQTCVDLSEPPLSWHGGTMTAN